MRHGAIRDLVLRDCQRPENVFGPSFFEQHLTVVAGYATELAQRLGADADVVELAAWLHDLAAVRDVAALPDHARLSAALARDVLQGYPLDVIENVARCITSHTTPHANGTPEEICVSNADAMAQIARPAYWCWVVFGLRKMGFEHGREWLRQRYEANWKGLIPEAREMIGHWTSARLFGSEEAG